MLFVYRPGFETKYRLLVIAEAWKTLDKRKVTGAISTDISQAFDRISNGLLISQLAPYGFEKSALILV